jgi:hypothetical protein
VRALLRSRAARQDRGTPIDPSPGPADGLRGVPVKDRSPGRRPGGPGLGGRSLGGRGRASIARVAGGSGQSAQSGCREITDHARSPGGESGVSAVRRQDLVPSFGAAPRPTTEGRWLGEQGTWRVVLKKRPTVHGPIGRTDAFLPGGDVQLGCGEAADLDGRSSRMDEGQDTGEARHRAGFCLSGGPLRFPAVYWKSVRTPDRRTGQDRRRNQQRAPRPRLVTQTEVSMSCPISFPRHLN